MTTQFQIRPARFALVLLTSLAHFACTDDEKKAEPAMAGANAGGADSVAEPSPAVMVVGQIFTTDTYNTYVGVFPDVPEGDVSFAKFREFGNANAYTHGGYIFVEEEGRVKRFSVNDELELVEGPEFGWQDFGVATINASYTVFISSERAYTFAPELGTVIVWNPETMKYTGELPVEIPERPAGMETWAYDGHLLGDKVVWNVFSGSFEALTIHPAITLAIADANSDAPVEFIEDDRCLPGGPAFVNEQGDYLVNGGGYFGYFYAYGNVPEGRTCMLRMRAGQSEIDADFALDYQELTGSYVNEPWFHVSGNQYFARVWDPEVEFPDDPEMFWSNAALRSVLVDLDEGTTTPYPDLEGVAGIDGTTRVVDGVSYFQVSDTGYVEGGNTRVVELHPDGIRQRFHLDGFLLGLERVR